ncbi:hypothetical protein [Natronorarus salvus]|uniref:hypothetical protein n=1 Tax=Natronorarus salvus TaxID=3117733 RepID=UPI002F264BCC
MPIGRSDWRDGVRRESRYHHILELLETNQDTAYSAREITDHISFTTNAKRSLIRDRLAQILVASMLEYLVYDGVVEVRETHGEKHYCLAIE